MLSGSGFILLNALDTKKGSIVGSVGLTLWGITEYLAGSRNGLGRVVFYLLAIMAVVVLRKRAFKRQWVINSFVIGCTVVMVVLVTKQFYQVEEYTALREGAYEKLYYGGDSRSSVAQDMFEVSTIKDLIVGYGVSGGYWSPHFQDFRTGIEIGYLQIVVKSGFIMLALFLILAIPAAFKGFKGAGDDQKRIAGILVLERLVWMVTFGLPWVHWNYLLFWMAVGECHRQNQDEN